VPNKINGYPATATAATDPLAGLKGRSGSGQVAEAPAADSAAPVQGGGATADHVTLTDSALQLQKLGAAVASAPVVNVAKVVQVKKAVESGTYTVNTQRVADKILGFETGLPGQ
jgi:negative regulator of flagellin synthesis FlgM